MFKLYIHCRSSKCRQKVAWSAYSWADKSCCSRRSFSVESLVL